MFHYLLSWVIVSLFCPLCPGFYLNRVSPNVLPINVQGSIKLWGYGLQKTTSVVFEPVDGGNNLIFFPNSTSPSEISLDGIQSSTALYATIHISDGVEISSSRLLFQFYKQPSFTCCTPNNVPYYGRFQVTIKGTDFFYSEHITVRLAPDDKIVTGVYVSSTIVTFESPAMSESVGSPVKIVSLAMDGLHYANAGGGGLNYEKQDPIKLAFIYLGRINDKGWTYSQNNGRKAIEVKYQGSVQTDFIENVEESVQFTNDNHTSQYKNSLATILDFCARNFSIIFTGSFGFMEQSRVASEDPICRRKPTHLVSATGVYTSRYMSTAFSKVFQAKYLAGMTAGYKLGSTLRKSMSVGYIGGIPIPEVYRGFNSFLLGCQKANPACTVKVIWIMTFENRTLERAAAEYLWEVEGCDIIAQESDSEAPSTVYTEKGGFSIGYNSDQSALVGNRVLTSPYVEWSVLYSYFVDKLLNGEKMEGDAYWPGMTETAASLWPFSNRVDVNTRSRVTEVWSELKNGERQIFCESVLNISTGTPPVPGDFNSDKCLTDLALLGMQFTLAGVEMPKSKGPSNYGELVYSDGIPIFVPPIIVEVKYQKPIYFIVICSLISSAGIILTCGSGGFMLKHRNNEWFRVHRIYLLSFILLGILLLFILPFVLFIEGTTDQSCSASRVFEHLIILLISPSICLKTLHLHLKYTLRQRKKSQISKYEHSVSTQNHPDSENSVGNMLNGNEKKTSSSHLEKDNAFTDDKRKTTAIVLFILCGFIIYVVIWLSIDPPKVSKIYIESEKLTIYDCTPFSTFDYILFVPEILTLLCALNLVLMHPKVPKKFNELKYIAFCLYTVFVLGMILIPVAMLTGNDYPLTLDVMTFFGIMVLAVSLYVSLFAIKITKIIQKKKINKAQPKRSISSHVGSPKRNAGSIYLGKGDQMDGGVASASNFNTFSDTASTKVSTYNLDTSMKSREKSSYSLDGSGKPVGNTSGDQIVEEEEEAAIQSETT